MSPHHAPTECIEVGCANLVERGGRCSSCRMAGAARPSEELRPGPRARGYGKRWETARRRHLELERWCRYCGKPGREVDHVIPHRGAECLFWLRANWQTLCTPDHSRKTAYERRIPIGMMYPLELPATERQTVLLCGPDIGYTAPTTGAVLDENLGMRYQDALPSGIRLEDPIAHLEWRNTALQEELAKDRHAGPLWFVTPAPRTAERAFWSHLLREPGMDGAAPQLLMPAIEGLPPWWWEQYNRDQKAEEAMRRRGWTG